MTIYESIRTLLVRTFPRNRSVWVTISTDGEPTVRVPGTSLFYHRTDRGRIYVCTYHESPDGTVFRHGYYDVDQIEWRKE